MQNTLLGALALVALTACWGPAKPSSTGGGGAGGGDTGGAGGDSCSSCGDVALRGEPSTAICANSVNFFTSLQGCGCDQGPCAASCYESLCSGLAASSDCQKCMTSMCASTYALCSKDSAH